AHEDRHQPWARRGGPMYGDAPPLPVDLDLANAGIANRPSSGLLGVLCCPVADLRGRQRCEQMTRRGLVQRIARRADHDPVIGGSQRVRWGYYPACIELYLRLNEEPMHPVQLRSLGVHR